MSIFSLNWQAAHAWLLAHEGYWAPWRCSWWAWCCWGYGQDLVPADRRITCNRMAIDAFLSG